MSANGRAAASPPANHRPAGTAWPALPRPRSSFRSPGCGEMFTVTTRAPAHFHQPHVLPAPPGEGLEPPQYVPSSGRVQPRLCPPDYFLKRLCQWPSSSRCSARLAPAQTGCCLNSQPTPRSVDPRPWQWTHAAQPRDTR